MDIVIEKKLSCSVSKAFSMFILNENIETWLCHKAHIEPMIGGKYELYFDGTDYQNHNTIGCKILDFDYNKYLSIEWKAPKKFSFINFCKPLTKIELYFIYNDTGTTIKLVHSGFKNEPKWVKAKKWFYTAWQETFKILALKCNQQNQSNKW